MKLASLKKVIPNAECRDFKDVEITAVVCDSRHVGPGSLYVAVCGAKLDGHAFIQDAVNRGCAAVVCGEPPANLGVPVLRVPDPRAALVSLCREFHDHPADRLKLTGITGTNGKTTTAFLIKSGLESAGRNVGMLGTIKYMVGSREIEAPITTPGAADLQGFFGEMVKAGVTHAVMEVSSHSLVQRRVEGLAFAVGVFTNVTQDHLDYHGTLDKYRAAKAILFEMLAPSAVAVLNADDPAAKYFAGKTKARIITYGLEEKADITASVKRSDMGGTRMTISLFGKGRSAETRLIGLHNVYNILAAHAACVALGESADKALDGILSVRHVPGRLEAVDRGQGFTVMVDFAHTEDALKNVLSSLRKVTKKRILVVFGCGGDRDKTKRPKMGAAVADLSDYAVVTSDNPRTEDPMAIIREIEAGIRDKSRYCVVCDRREAIRAAMRAARPGDAVVIAGKGHEAYQIFKDRTVPFNDVAEAESALADMGHGGGRKTARGR
jgi:UDP-N-acetylmuramoyl-L-alanyl-D-glutamate--2,6-diaminopimelate ligase